MTNVINFPTDIEYKVLFNLPTGKVLKMHKGPEDNFEIQIDNGHGIAWLQATGKMNAKDRVQKVFPNSEILEVTTT